MKFTLSWLKDHLDITAGAPEISAKLTAIGLEVESLTDNSETLAPFTVAEILHAEKHPQADKLQVCRVNTGSEELQIVCGAPNARAGLKVALAREGAVIPANGMKIKKSAIRGVESNGMLCSERELGLGGDHNGIMELPQDATLGASIVDALGLNDPIFDIAVTPNRADCLGVRGIARDLAAAGMGMLLPLPHAGEGRGEGALPASPHLNPSPQGEREIRVTLATEDCPQFLGRSIKGVKNGPSPAWMQQRLKAIGLRPISALVDITNYIAFDLGRPLHVFDAAKLSGNLTVREAKPGEKLLALNEKEYALSTGMTVIADDTQLLALGGVMGGMESGCADTTTDIFLEVAYFSPANIAKTGRALQIDSDARYRFERGVDPAFLPEAMEIATQRILELCGGTAGDVVSAGNAPAWEGIIDFRPARVESLGGVKVAENEQEKILNALGFAVEANGAVWQITPPSWRGDVGEEADIVEEILRIHGFEQIPSTPLPKLENVSKPSFSPLQKRARLARRLLASRGLMECVTWSFIPKAQAASFGGAKEELALLNPISADLDAMRPSLLPNLLTAANKNMARGFIDLALFETGAVFENPSPDGQKLHAAGIRSGAYARKHVHDAGRGVDAFDAKADALALLSQYGVAADKLHITRGAPGWYHPGRSGALTLGGKITLGYFGELHPSLLLKMDVSTTVAAFEILLNNIPEPRAKATKAKPMLAMSDFQAVERDFAFIVDQSLEAAALLKAINAAEKQLIVAVNVFDVYQGKGVAEGKKSIALSVTLQAADRTLKDEEIEAIGKRIIEAAGKLGATLRS